MFTFFFLGFLVCIVGLIRPFANLKRKHYGWGAAGAFFLMAVTAPPTENSTATAEASPKPTLSPAEAQQVERDNSADIAKLKKKVASVPATEADENLRIYTRLVELAPGNTDFMFKKAEYEMKVEARARYADHPEEALKITDLAWSKGGFGSIMIIDRITVRNDAPFSIKDFVLKCVHQGPSGTDMDRNSRRVYEIVPAAGTKTVREVNMGFIHSQVATSRCEITDAVAA